MKISTSLTLAALTVLLAGFSQFAAAQDASTLRMKALGETLAGHEHEVYQRLGMERARVLYHYSQLEQPIPMAEAKQLVTGIRKDIEASDAALTKIKAQHAKEPAVLKQIELIEKHHADAREVCGMAEKECLKQHGDHVVIGNCCSDMWHHLDAAQAETQKLLKMLKIAKLDAPKKVETKK